MRQGFMRFLAVVNVLLAGGLVVAAMWLYGQEHETRAMERQIRALERSTKLEEETIRRLQIEWHRLRNPLRLDALAQQRLPLATPDPQVVLREDQALALLPLRPPAALEEGISGHDAGALATLAQEAVDDGDVAGNGNGGIAAGGNVAAGRNEAAGAVMNMDAGAEPADRALQRGDDALGGLIRGILPDGGAAQ